MRPKLLILGYTRSGHAVLLRSPASGELGDWTRGDHVDATVILLEHSEREQDPMVRSWCRHWLKEHRALQKSARRVNIRGAAEISIKVRRPR